MRARSIEECFGNKSSGCVHAPIGMYLRLLAHASRVSFTNSPESMVSVSPLTPHRFLLPG